MKNKLNASTILGWTFGTIFLLWGFFKLFSNPVIGTLGISLGLIIFPPFWNEVRSKWNFALSNKYKALLFLVLFIVTIVVNGQSNSEQSASNTSEVSNSAYEQSTNLTIDGKVEPSVASQGEKVVITFTVTNNDETKSVDMFHIRFADDDFIKNGFKVTSVMSGGVNPEALPNDFVWNNDLMKILPGETRTFTIVGVAEHAGNYESTVTFAVPRSKDGVILDYLDQELNAKLIVN